MTKRSAINPAVTVNTTTVIDLAARTGFSLEQIETGVTLMRTGRADLIEAVITGRMDIRKALKLARKGDADSRPDRHRSD
jgi:hypothetical protein